MGVCLLSKRHRLRRGYRYSEQAAPPDTQLDVAGRGSSFELHHFLGQADALRVSPSGEKGQKVSDAQMQLNIEHQSVCSSWNCTIQPRVTVLSHT